jgi:hypothetical protein
VPETKALISDELKQRVEDVARQQNREPAEVVEEALGRYLASQRLKDTFAYGEGQARKLGILAEDVDGIVREERDKSKLAR